MRERLTLGQRALIRKGIVLVTLAAMPPAVGAVEGRPETYVFSGSISGSVVSADASQPLQHAEVVLVPASAQFDAGSGQSRLPAGAMLQLTAADGSYHFANVPPGRYQLYVQRIGYQSTRLEVELSEEATLRLSVGLIVDPIELSPIEVTATVRDVYGRDMSFQQEIEIGRIASERWRQDVFLQSDVRVLTHTDVVEAITFGDTDIFRALQRAPGVSTRDDWTAELWVRGAPWGQTRVYFDELPLFNPTHYAGLVSAISSEAVGAVVLHTGVRSAAIGEGSAGTLNIESRQAGGHGDFRGYFNTSLSNVSLAAEKRFIDGSLGAAVVARGSLDTESRLNSDLGQLPDDFFDLVGTIDLDIDERRRLEISGIWEEDFIRGDIDDGPIDNQMEWGNRAGRVTLQLPLFGGVFRQTLGFSRFNNSVVQTVRKSRLAIFDPRPTQPNTQNDIRYGLVSGEFVAANANDRSGWRGGYQLSQYRVSYLGASANPFPVQTFNYSLLIKQDVTVAALWAERRWELERLSLQAGLRVEAGDGHGEDWGAALAPRLSARYAVDDRLSISGAAGRSYQYLHELAPAGLRLGPRLATSHIRLAAGEDGTVPLRTDKLSAGAEYWLGRAWLATANTYVRYSTGVVMPDPSPGSIDEQRFRVNGTNLARGLELSARRLAGRWTASFAYTLAKSEIKANGFKFASPTDRRHQVDATFTSRFPNAVFGGSMRLGSAVGVGSGAPYTRVHLGSYNCDIATSSCEAIVPNIAERPNAERSDWSSRIDFMGDWTKQFSAWSFGFYAQMLNAANSDRGITYAVNENDCRRRGPGDPFCSVDLDEFVPGVSRFHVVGIRINW